MIGSLRGTLREIEGPIALIEAGGVGYEVTLAETTLLRLPPVGEEVEVRIRQIFREDGVSLFGFAEPSERRLFDLLTTVKGCGPKIAMALLGALGEEGVIGAIQTADARSLARANGVGARLAERILLELKDKVLEEGFRRRVAAATSPSRAVAAAGDELIDALLALGYRRTEAESAAEEARAGAEGVEAQLRLALRSLKR